MDVLERRESFRQFVCTRALPLRLLGDWKMASREIPPMSMGKNFNGARPGVDPGMIRSEVQSFSATRGRYV